MAAMRASAWPCGVCGNAREKPALCGFHVHRGKMCAQPERLVICAHFHCEKGDLSGRVPTHEASSRKQEEPMRSVKLAMCAAALTLGATIASANAQEMATIQTCLSTGAQLKTALEANVQSANYQDAMKERNTGLLYCNSGFYA